MSDDGRPPVVVVGAGGAVGLRLCRAWAQEGRRVRRIGRAGDLRWDALAQEPPPCPEARGAGVVVLAGVTPGPGADLSLNTDLARAGIAAARGWGAAHVFVTSSSAVYGPTSPRGASEASPTAPAGAYGRAKLDMEAACAADDVTALRLTNVAGAAQPFLSIRQGGRTLDRFDVEDAPSRSFIGPVALSRCLAALCDHAARGTTLPPVLNVAARAGLSMEDVFRARDITPERVPAPAGAMAHVHLNVDLLDAYWPVPAQDARALWSEVHATDGEAG